MDGRQSIKVFRVPPVKNRDSCDFLEPLIRCERSIPKVETQLPALAVFTNLITRFLVITQLQMCLLTCLTYLLSQSVGPCVLTHLPTHMLIYAYTLTFLGTHLHTPSRMCLATHRPTSLPPYLLPVSLAVFQ